MSPKCLKMSLLDEKPRFPLIEGSYFSPPVTERRYRDNWPIFKHFVILVFFKKEGFT